MAAWTPLGNAIQTAYVTSPLGSEHAKRIVLPFHLGILPVTEGLSDIIFYNILNHCGLRFSMTAHAYLGMRVFTLHSLPYLHLSEDISRHWDVHDNRADTTAATPFI